MLSFRTIMTATLKRQFIDGPEGQIHLRAGGAGERAFYAIHQSPASSRIYEPLLKELSRDRRVAAADTPGYGESDPPPSLPSISDYARAHGAVLDALGYGSVDIMGYFTGSRIAVELALQRPRQVRRLILLGAAVYTPAELSQERTTYAEREPDWEMSHLKGWWDHLKNHRNPAYPLNSFLRDFSEIQRHGRVSPWGHMAAHAYSLVEALPKVRQPVAVLCTDDSIGAISMRASAYLSTGRTIRLPYPSQGILELHTKEIAEQVRQWFDR